MRRKLLFLLLLPFALGAFEGYLPAEPGDKPWLTGPLVTSSGNTAQAGSWNIESYASAFARTAFYDNHWRPQSEETLWNVYFRVPVWVGVSEWLDFKITPSWSWNRRGGASQWTLGDWSASAGIQLYRDRLPHPNWLPSMKLFIRETFPTGPYQNLSPAKKGTDSGGNGTYRTTFGFCASKVFSFSDCRFLNILGNLIYSIPTSVHVKGFNSYGGGYGTLGTVKPEQFLQGNLAFEYALTRHWVLALDAVAIFATGIQFSGIAGSLTRDNANIDAEGIPITDEQLASIQYSLAPAVEYNFSEDLGIIVGSWFTVAGKNSARFASAIAALNYTF